MDAEAQEHNPVGRLTKSKHQFTEVFVLGQENTIFGECATQEIFIRGAAQVFDGKQHVVAVGAQGSHQASVAAFIGQEVHRMTPSANRISSDAM